MALYANDSSGRKLPSTDGLRSTIRASPSATHPEQLVECRRDFSGLDPRYRVDMTTMRIDFLRHIGDQHDYDGARLSRNGFEIFFEARQQVEFYDDVLPCLQRLKQRYRLGSITNW